MKEAVTDYGRALKLHPSAENFVNRGRALVELERLADAVQDLTEAIELDPQDGEAWYHRGRARWRIGDINGAEAVSAVRSRSATVMKIGWRIATWPEEGCAAMNGE